MYQSFSILVLCLAGESISMKNVWRYLSSDTFLSLFALRLDPRQSSFWVSDNPSCLQFRSFPVVGSSSKETILFYTFIVAAICLRAPANFTSALLPTVTRETMVTHKTVAWPQSVRVTRTSTLKLKAVRSTSAALVATRMGPTTDCSPTPAVCLRVSARTKVAQTVRLATKTHPLFVIVDYLHTSRGKYAHTFSMIIFWSGSLPWRCWQRLYGHPRRIPGFTQALSRHGRLFQV